MFPALQLQPGQRGFSKLPSRLVSEELHALSEFCNVHTDEPVCDHIIVLRLLLSNDCGGISDEEKAKSLVSGFGRSWLFNPASCPDKTIGSILRQFFIKHSASCIQFVSFLQNEIYAEANCLLLKSLRDQVLVNQDEAWEKILHFADWRRFIICEWLELKKLLDALNSELPDFFLGGIQSCLKRKHGIEASTWTTVLEFAGWKRSLPDILTPCQSFLKATNGNDAIVTLNKSKFYHVL